MLSYIWQNFSGEVLKSGEFSKLEESIKMYKYRNDEKEEILANDENIKEQIKVRHIIVWYSRLYSVQIMK